MSRSTRESAATRALIARIDARSTGRLSVVAGGSEVAVHLLSGDLVSASADDELLLAIRMLARQGYLQDTEAERLEIALDSGEDVFGHLLQYGPAFDEVLRERFRQNVCDYLSSGAPPRFYEQRTILVQNIQIGHDARKLVDELCTLCDFARGVDPDQTVVRGRVDTGGDRIAMYAVRLLSMEPRPIAALIEDLPVEPTRARVLVGQWIERGILAVLEAEQSTPIVADVTTYDADMDTVHHALLYEEDETHSSEPAAVTYRPAPVRHEAPPPTSRAAARADGGWPSGMRAGTPVGPPARGEAGRPPPRPAPVRPAEDDFDEDIEDERTEQVDLRTVNRYLQPTSPPPAPPTPPSHEAPTRRPADPRVARPAEPVNRPEDRGVNRSRGPSPPPAPRYEDNYDELDAFQDNDYERGSSQSGRFTSQTHNLDRVEVDAMPVMAAPEERDRARGAHFGAPSLSQTEALQKIAVASEVLAVIAEAFDESIGVGQGPEQVQLLLDTSPPTSAGILSHLRVNDLGQLPQHALVRNLMGRPVREQRQLLNSALIDLVERALSTAADELPDHALTRVLASARGYRQRIGL